MFVGSSVHGYSNFLWFLAKLAAVVKPAVPGASPAVKLTVSPSPSAKQAPAKKLADSSDSDSSDDEPPTGLVSIFATAAPPLRCFLCLFAFFSQGSSVCETDYGTETKGGNVQWKWKRVRGWEAQSSARECRYGKSFSDECELPQITAFYHCFFFENFFIKLIEVFCFFWCMIDTGPAKSAVVAGKTNGAPAKKPLPAMLSSSSESDSDAGSKAKPIVAAAKVVAGKLIPQKAANVSSSGSDSSSDEDAVSEPPSKQAPVVAGKPAAKRARSTSSDDSDDAPEQPLQMFSSQAKKQKTVAINGHGAPPTPGKVGSIIWCRFRIEYWNVFCGFFGAKFWLKKKRVIIRGVFVGFCSFSVDFYGLI